MFRHTLMNQQLCAALASRKSLCDSHENIQATDDSPVVLLLDASVEFVAHPWLQSHWRVPTARFNRIRRSPWSQSHWRVPTTRNCWDRDSLQQTHTSTTKGQASLENVAGAHHGW